ncbi:MAG TPA: hypothetical protein ENK10_00430 [Acidobacteria bacterium]|nr:hypothetical protein [Acidobacteriota bacterium]
MNNMKSVAHLVRAAGEQRRGWHKAWMLAVAFSLVAGACNPARKGAAPSTPLPAAPSSSESLLRRAGSSPSTSLAPTDSTETTVDRVDLARPAIVYRLPEVVDRSVFAFPDAELLRLPAGSDGKAVGYDGEWGPCCFATDGELLAIVDTINGRLLIADGASFLETALPIPRVLDIDIYDGEITLVGTFFHPGSRPSRPQLQGLRIAQVDSLGSLVAPPVQRDDLDVGYSGSSRDGAGSLWINVVPLGSLNAPEVWLEALGEGTLRNRPLPDGKLLSTSFDQDGTATIIHLAPDGTELTRWELTSTSPLQLEEVALDGADLIVVVTERSSVPAGGLLHRVLRLTPSSVTLLLSLEAVTEPYVESGGSFAWDAATDRLIRLLPDRDGASIVSYDTSR